MESILSVSTILNEINRRRAELSKASLAAAETNESAECLRLNAENVALGELMIWIREKYVAVEAQA